MESVNKTGAVVYIEPADTKPDQASRRAVYARTQNKKLNNKLHCAFK